MSNTRYVCLQRVSTDDITGQKNYTDIYSYLIHDKVSNTKMYVKGSVVRKKLQQGAKIENLKLTSNNRIYITKDVEQVAKSHVHESISLSAILVQFYGLASKNRIRLGTSKEHGVILKVMNKSEKELNNTLQTSRALGHQIIDVNVGNEVAYVIVVGNMLLVIGYSIYLDTTEVTYSQYGTHLKIHMKYILEQCSITEIYVDGLIFSGNRLDYFAEYTKVKKIVIRNSNLSKVRSMDCAFACTPLEHLEITGTTLDSLETIQSAFANCKNLKTIILPEMPRIKYIDSLFEEAIFKNSDIINNLKWITSNNLQSASKAFMNTNLISIDLRHLNLEHVLRLDNMFMGCKNLESVQFSDSKTPKLCTIAHMFNGCCNIKRIDLGNIVSDKLINKPVEKVKGTEFYRERTTRMFAGVPRNCNISIRQELIDIIKKNNV